MNPSLLSATFLCTAACAASAQTSVSIYGIADAWVGQTRHKVGGPATGRMSVVESGGAQASRWGLRGSEDLGGGLSVRFVLEQGISIDSGTVSNVSASKDGFNRNAYVALAKSGLGEVRLGRMLTAYDALRGSNNQLYDSSGFASTGQVWSAGAEAGNGQAAVKGSDYLARGNNTVLLRTAPLGPFIASVSVSAGEKATTETASPRLVTGHVEYAAGAVRVGYAFQNERYTSGTNKFDMVAAAYKFTHARLVANYQHQDDGRVAAGQKSREVQVGVDAPFGAATVALGYAKAVTRDGAGREIVDASGLSAMATYDLSKRTRLYMALRKLSVDRADGSQAFEQTRYGLGMTHAF